MGPILINSMSGNLFAASAVIAPGTLTHHSNQQPKVEFTDLSPFLRPAEANELRHKLANERINTDLWKSPDCLATSVQSSQFHHDPEPALPSQERPLGNPPPRSPRVRSSRNDEWRLASGSDDDSSADKTKDATGLEQLLKDTPQNSLTEKLYDLYESDVSYDPQQLAEFLDHDDYKVRKNAMCLFLAFLPHKLEDSLLEDSLLEHSRLVVDVLAYDDEDDDGDTFRETALRMLERTILQHPLIDEAKLQEIASHVASICEEKLQELASYVTMGQYPYLIEGVLFPTQALSVVIKALPAIHRPPYSQKLTSFLSDERLKYFRKNAIGALTSALEALTHQQRLECADTIARFLETNDHRDSLKTLHPNIMRRTHYETTMASVEFLEAFFKYLGDTERPSWMIRMRQHLTSSDPEVRRMAILSIARYEDITESNRRQWTQIFEANLLEGNPNDTVPRAAFNALLHIWRNTYDPTVPRTPAHEVVLQRAQALEAQLTASQSNPQESMQIYAALADLALQLHPEDRLGRSLAIEKSLLFDIGQQSLETPAAKIAIASLRRFLPHLSEIDRNGHIVLLTHFLPRRREELAKLIWNNIPKENTEESTNEFLKLHERWYRGDFDPVLYIKVLQQLHLLDNTNPSKQWETIEQLRTLATELGYDQRIVITRRLTARLKDPRPHVRKANVYVLAIFVRHLDVDEQTEWASKIRPLLNDEDAEVRAFAVDALRLIELGSGE